MAESPVVVRPASLTDAGALAVFLQATARGHGRTERPTPADAVARLRQGHPDLVRDSALVFAGAEIIGFMHLWRADDDEVRVFARTHPEHQREGIGTALLERAEGRALDILGGVPRGRVTATQWAHDSAGAGLFRARAYAPVRSFLRMSIDGATASRLAARPPAGVRIAAFREGIDNAALFAAFVDAFADHWSPDISDEEHWWNERAHADRALWALAWRGEELVGFVLLECRDDAGRISDIGVIRSARRRGIGYALLANAFSTLNELRVSTIRLDVDAENASGARELYRRAGMLSDPTFTIWEKTLDRPMPERVV
jgi:mycothiol synthase